MKNKTKLTAAVALLVTTALTATACGSNDNGNSGSNGAANNGTAATNNTAANAGGNQAADPEADVSIVAWDKPHADDADKAFREQQFAEFDAKYPHIKVTHFEPAKEKGREQFMTAVAGGEQPDVVLNAYPDMESYISQGITADITDMWNAYAEKDQFLPSSLNAATVDGKIYGIPSTMYVTGMMYNKKLFSDAGIDPNAALKDWDSFGAAAQKLTDAAKGTYGYALLGMDWADWFFEYYVWQAGGDLTEKQADGSAKLTFTSDAAVKALQYYKDLKFKYKATQKNVVQSLDDNQKDFYTGHAASMVAASDWFGTLVTKGMDINDIGFSALPAGPSGEVTPSQVGGNYWILNPKASKEKQQAAFTYATFFSSKDQLEGSLQYYHDNGIFPNLLTVRTDVDVSKYVEGLPADLVTNVQNATANTHLEYFLKSRLSSYIVKPIQKVLLDEKADPKAQLQAAQDLAQKEVADKYNAEIKK